MFPFIDKILIELKIDHYVLLFLAMLLLIFWVILRWCRCEFCYSCGKKSLEKEELMSKCLYLADHPFLCLFHKAYVSCFDLL